MGSGIEPRPSALAAWRLSHWTTSKVPGLGLKGSLAAGGIGIGDYRGQEVQGTCWQVAVALPSGKMGAQTKVVMPEAVRGG